MRIVHAQSSRIAPEPVRLLGHVLQVAVPTGFEPAISALTGPCVRPTTPRDQLRSLSRGELSRWAGEDSNLRSHYGARFTVWWF